ncbi:hypothetical protein QTP88_007925 [Uroleucon formosanum]
MLIHAIPSNELLSWARIYMIESFGVGARIVAKFGLETEFGSHTCYSGRFVSFRMSFDFPEEIQFHGGSSSESPLGKLITSQQLRGAKNLRGGQSIERERTSVRMSQEVQAAVFLLETSDDETRDVGIQVDENKGAIVNITNKDIIKTEKINLNTPEGYHYSQEIDKEKYLKTIREKELLNKSVRSLSPASDSDSSIKRRTGLRSDKGVVHTELPITKRVRKPKDMSEMDIDKATTLIPVCTGAKNLSEFINTCDIAVKSVDKNNLPLLIKIINSKLAGNALEATKYRDTEKWEDIKSILKGAFEHRASERTLTIGLNFARMEENESVTSFASRVEELYYKLCTEGSKNMSEEESKVYKKQLKNQALIIFLNGLPKHLKLALKARDPKTLETAMQFAKDEEMEHNANLQMEKLTKNMKNQNLKGNNNTSGK